MPRGGSAIKGGLLCNLPGGVVAVTRGVVQGVAVGGGRVGHRGGVVGVGPSRQPVKHHACDQDRAAQVVFHGCGDKGRDSRMGEKDNQVFGITDLIIVNS